jgi:hypothetical protein
VAFGLAIGRYCTKYEDCKGNGRPITQISFEEPKKLFRN